MLLDTAECSGTRPQTQCQLSGKHLPTKQETLRVYYTLQSVEAVYKCQKTLTRQATVNRGALMRQGTVNCGALTLQGATIHGTLTHQGTMIVVP